MELITEKGCQQVIIGLKLSYKMEGRIQVTLL